MNRHLMMVIAVIAVLAALVLLVAAIDGGREDLRQITQPVPLADPVPEGES